MLPTNRLFSIIQILRSAKFPIKARQLSEELEVSIRTIYRDIAELQNQHVPIVGEAGIGYILKQGYDMPPLMLTANELEVVLLGAHWVSQRGDPTLANGARDLLAKIAEVVPDHLQSVVIQSTTIAPVVTPVIPDHLNMNEVREAIGQQSKLIIQYADEAGATSERIIWPIVVAYFETVRLLVAWCELRHDFRHFRTDRISSLIVLDERFPGSIETLRREWKSRDRQQQVDKVHRRDTLV